MKKLILVLLLFTGIVSAQSTTVNGNSFTIDNNGNLRINTTVYNVVDQEFLYVLGMDNLWLPLWIADQLDQYVFQSYPIAEGSIGRGVFTQDFTQLNNYTGDSRLVRVTKIYETWYFHSGTNDPEYGYRLGMTDTEDNGGRHDTSLEDVRQRAILLSSRGNEVGVYRFTRITYDALMEDQGRWYNVPGLDRITIHSPYQLIERF